MVEIIGFRALRFAPDAIGSYADVTAPPYDIINDRELRRLWECHPFNVVRLILPAGDLPVEQREEGYRRAAERLRAWKRQGILVADARPSLYLYRQRFHLPDGQPKTRQGFFGLARLTDWGQGICRHELTLPGPVTDRLRLLEACRANLSSAFGLYSDPQQEVVGVLAAEAEGRPPEVEVTDDAQVWHGLWPVSNRQAIRVVGELLRDRPVVIADGHHRYTAALAYRNCQRAACPHAEQPAPWDYVLFYLDAFEDPGLAILPTHQVVCGLNGFVPATWLEHLAERWTVHKLPDLGALVQALAARDGAPQVALGVVVAGGHCYLLEVGRPAAREAPEEALDVSVLRRELIAPLLGQHGAVADLERHLRYTHSAQEASAWVSGGQADVAFILRATPLEQVRAVALAGRVMPQKSTYFYPKLLSGLVFYDHTERNDRACPLAERAISEERTF
mgnify:CR=1 FL=1